MKLEPTHVADADAVGVEATVSYARKNFGHEGGGLQLELHGRGTFTNGRPVPPGGL